MKNNNQLNNSTRSTKRLAVAGMMMIGSVLAANAAVVINDTAHYDDLNLEAPVFKVSTPSQFIAGTGSVKYGFKFDVEGGCCVRVKAEMVRRTVTKGSVVSLTPNFGPEIVVASKMFEICKTLAEGTTLTTNLGANDDDANFFVRFSNPDTWNKSHVVISNILVSFPTPVLRLSTDPNVPLTLTQGQQEERTFSVPDKRGTLRIDLSWTNAATVRIRVFKPSGGNAVATVTSASGQTKLNTADIPVGASDSGDWRIEYTNMSSSNVTAASIGTTIKMTVNE